MSEVLAACGSRSTFREQRYRVVARPGGFWRGQGVMSHAGLALLRHLADKTGLTGGRRGR
jgi:hypothetical protein